MLTTWQHRAISLILIVVGLFLVLGNTILKPYVLLSFGLAGAGLVTACAIAASGAYRPKKKTLLVLALVLVFVCLTSFFIGSFSASGGG